MSAGLSSDLVRDSKLDMTTTCNDIVRHVIEGTDHNSRHRRSQIYQEWRRVKRLGKGAYGEVWLDQLDRGTCHVNERAVKVIEKRTKEQRPVDYSRELEAIAKFSHPKYNRCFVKSFGWYEDDRNVFITMEYLHLGDLQAYLSYPLPETEVQQIAFQIVEGLKFMHHNGFTHRDLKPSNILIESRGPDWWVKIGDFGISKRSTALRTFTGTEGFLAPELLAQIGYLVCEELRELRGYTNAVDIWSLGEIIFRALVNKPPFATDLASYVRGTAPFPDQILRSHGITENGRDFVRKILLPMPTDRLSAADALEHPWIESQAAASTRSFGEFHRPQSVVLDAQPTTNVANNHDPSPTVASGVWSTIQDSINEDITKCSKLETAAEKLKPKETAKSTVMSGTAGLDSHLNTVLPTLPPQKDIVKSTPPKESHLALNPPIFQDSEILRNQTTNPKPPNAHLGSAPKENVLIEVSTHPNLARPRHCRSRQSLAATDIQASDSTADSSDIHTSHMIMNTWRQQVGPEESQIREAGGPVRSRRRARALSFENSPTTTEPRAQKSDNTFPGSQADGSGLRKAYMAVSAQRYRDLREKRREKNKGTKESLARTAGVEPVSGTPADLLADFSKETELS